MRVSVTPEAAEFVQDNGGHLYVWADDHVCCGGTRFIKSSLEPPRSNTPFEAVDDGQSFLLFVRPAQGHLPDELVVDLRGRRLPRVRAGWNGCAYLV